MRNVIVTGIPRAGTTLVAARLDAEPDSLCLNEPEWQYPSPRLNAMQFAEAVAADFDATRAKLLAGEAVTDKRAPDGSAVTNYYGTETINFALRRELPQDFTLAMKHNGPYLAVLPELIALKAFEIRAVIRKPLPVLRSWRRLRLPISEGKLPNATPYWPELQRLTGAQMPLLEKQMRIYELLLARICDHQSQLTLLRYEDIAQGDGQRSEQPTHEDDAIMHALQKYAPRAWEYQQA